MSTTKPKLVIKSNNIEKLLKEKHMSQVELADLALDGQSSYLNRIIKNQRPNLTLPIAVKIANVLNTPVEDVFTFGEEEKKLFDKLG